MNNVARLRKLRKMTQDEFAELCGLSRISIARYEASGEVSRASAERIAKACHVSVSYVLGDVGETTEDDEVWNIRERLRADPDMRALFSAATKATPEHIRAVTATLKALEADTCFRACREPTGEEWAT